MTLKQMNLCGLKVMGLPKTILSMEEKDKTDLGYKGLGYLQAFFRQVKYNTGVPICIDKEFMAPLELCNWQLELVRK